MAVGIAVVGMTAHQARANCTETGQQRGADCLEQVRNSKYINGFMRVTQ